MASAAAKQHNNTAINEVVDFFFLLCFREIRFIAIAKVSYRMFVFLLRLLVSHDLLWPIFLKVSSTPCMQI